MSEDEKDGTVLGKRTRGGQEDLKAVDEGPSRVPQENEDDDDDDVGPMPMPAEASANGAAKKKRKGV